MLTKIRNAQAVKKETVTVPHSKIKTEIAKALLRSNYIKEINRRGKKSKKSLELGLLYDENKNGAISHISRISKPSQRVYLPVQKLRPIRQGYGMLILSTPKGVLTSKEAIRERVGGEILCKVW